MMDRGQAEGKGAASEKALLPVRGYSRGMTAYVHGDQDAATGSEMWPNHYAVILTPADVMAYSHTAQVVYLTSSKSKLELAKRHPHFVRVGRHAGKECVAVCNQVHTVDLTRLSHPADQVGPMTMRAIEDAVVDALGLSPRFARTAQPAPSTNGKKKKGGA